MSGSDQQIGFVGLGRMGTPMALNLHRAGASVTVFNRTAAKTAPLRDAGAAVAGSLAELAREADVLVTILTDARAAEEVIGAALEQLRPGALVVEMSTIGAEAARRLHARCAERGVAFADAPVSGATPLAERGELTAMVGAEEQDIPRLRQVLAPMTRAVHHLGGPGSGAAMKVALNTMLAVTNVAIAETLALAEAGGIEPAAAYEVIADSAVASPYVSYKREAFLQPDDAQLTFSCRDVLKDLGLAADAAASAGVTLPQTEAARELYAQATDDGLGDRDLTQVAACLKRGTTQ